MFGLKNSNFPHENVWGDSGMRLYWKWKPTMIIWFAQPNMFGCPTGRIMDFFVVKKWNLIALIVTDAFIQIPCNNREFDFCPFNIHSVTTITHSYHVKLSNKLSNL